MFILKGNDLNERPIIICLFGVGLIGTAIKNSFQQNYFNCKLNYLHFPYSWAEREKQKKELNDICKYIKKNKKENSTLKLFIVWSAGKSGFSALEETTIIEYEIYKETLLQLERLVEVNDIEESHFYLLSSAGGVFEGQINVDLTSIPSPKRPYGFLKLNQETFLLERQGFSNKKILRPTSVYSKTNIRNRNGLIGTLMINGLKNKVTNIIGTNTTIRDYILDEDIALFLVQNILMGTNLIAPYTFLASGKTSSLLEIKRKIELLLRKKIFVNYLWNKTNAVDMSYSSSMLPKSLKVSALESNLRILHASVLNYVSDN